MDVDTAFLNAELEKEIYITQPEGFIENVQTTSALCSRAYMV